MPVIGAVGAAGQFHGGLKAAAVQYAGQRIIKRLVLQGEAFLFFRVDIGNAADDAGMSLVVPEIACLNAAPQGFRVLPPQPDVGFGLFRTLLQLCEHIPELAPVFLHGPGAEGLLRRCRCLRRRTAEDVLPERRIGGVPFFQIEFKQHGVHQIGHDPCPLFLVGQGGYGPPVEIETPENERAHGDAESAEQQGGPRAGLLEGFFRGGGDVQTQRPQQFVFLKGFVAGEAGLPGKKGRHVAFFGRIGRRVPAVDRFRVVFETVDAPLLPVIRDTLRALRPGGRQAQLHAGEVHVVVEQTQQAARVYAHKGSPVACRFRAAGGREVFARRNAGFLRHQNAPHFGGPLMQIPIDLKNARHPVFINGDEAFCPLVNIEAVERIAEDEPCQRHKIKGAGFHDGLRGGVSPPV